jgi:tRNA U38,U39,U40 pseudouridine synthase TruA
MIWRYVLHYPFPLDEDKMRDAAARFVGSHDFAAFAASTGSEDDDKGTHHRSRNLTQPELVRSADNEELAFYSARAIRFCATWCGKWSGLCSTWGGEGWRPKISTSFMN